LSRFLFAKTEQLNPPIIPIPQTNADAHRSRDSQPKSDSRSAFFQNYSKYFRASSGLRESRWHIVPSRITHTSKTKERNRMIAESAPPRKRSAVLAIAIAGLAAGTLDLIQASILFGWKVPLVIAAGLLGPQAFRGGAGTFILGVLLHYFIATSAAAIYYAASRRLRFLLEHPLVCGLFYGIAVELVMSYVVLPLSALHARGPYKLHDVLLGLLVHMVVVGLPISFSIRRFAK
jgi:hypothetical protein